MKNKKILVCITGGIAVYKIATLVNLCQKYGAKVKVIMTEAATRFVSPLTFQSLIGDNVYTDLFESKNPEEIEHISLAKWADVVVVAPATANTISKIACGIADNLLTTVIMALPKNKKVIIAPAMNVEMWKNEFLQKNVELLKDCRGRYVFIEPRSGILACRDEGIGKLAKVEDIVEKIKNLK